MCTVVFIPANDKYYFASLRDENPRRPTAVLPELQVMTNATILAPIDALAGGTWIGINDSSNIIILLNGCFVKHTRKESYRKSRGLIVLELLNSQLPIVEWELTDLNDIEPFTLMVWSNQMLFQLGWDGTDKHRIALDITVPHILSSSTLYDAHAAKNRHDLFQHWVTTNSTIHKLSLLNFFKSHDDLENGFLMNRNEKVKTLSYSFLELNTQGLMAELDYYDFQNFSHNVKSLPLKTSVEHCTLPDL